MKKILLVIMAASVATLSGCASTTYMSQNVSDSDKSKAADEIKATMMAVPRYWSDEDAEKKIYELYARMLPAASTICIKMDEDECGWDIRYSNEDTVNAFASNESTVTIHKGVLKYAENDDEIAMVIAHELSHHAGDHIGESMANAQAGAAIGAALMGVASAYAHQNNSYGGYYVARDAANGASIGAAIGSLSYSKSQEREADYISAYILHNSGFDLKNARQFYIKLGKLGKGPHGGGKAFDSHPSPAERLARWDVTANEIIVNNGALPEAPVKNVSTYESEY